MWAAIQLFMIKNRWFSEDSVMSALGHFQPLKIPQILASEWLVSGAKRTLDSVPLRLIPSIIINTAVITHVIDQRCGV